MTEYSNLSPETKKLIEQSDELWQKIDIKELAEARRLLQKNVDAYRAAFEFDETHPAAKSINPMAHSNDRCLLKHAEDCLNEFDIAFAY